MIVNRDDRRGRATSFASVADAYERARPEYPCDAIRWLVGDGAKDVVDLGAGTGKLTRGLAGLGHLVTAVEPLPEMLEHLCAVAPAATALLGAAEEIPLPDASADVVVSAQAFHWFDHARALPEIARVLRPGGRLALVWNTRDDGEGWVADLSDAIIGRESIEDGDVLAPLRESGLFGPVETTTFSFVQTVDRDTLRDLVLSRSYCAVLPEDERSHVLTRVDALFDAHARDGVLSLPYVTECFRATLA